ncbi:hypothetical protein GCG54_00005802 [Colletotrichum gloeosporioides]|uniref:Uncharacterized protein n=1 Tax=Colletotrichum gloeosporioides TaxID=474922 RepID=A0A8H4CJS4_COLGL|nr:uncharacterized protein GCG54_00005802 [Colletotrichum gloeosporioides]KAF3805057.1 hypothetical protein GCG54_00005802 [Colletotrichum gloeosporioides]
MTDNSGNSFFFPNPPSEKRQGLDDKDENRRDYRETSSSSALDDSHDWSFLGDPDNSFELISERDADSSPSLRSLRSVRSLGSLELSPPLALSDWGSDDEASSSGSEDSLRSSRSAPDLRELQQLPPVPKLDYSKHGPALEWFMSQTFLDDSWKTPPDFTTEVVDKRARAPFPNFAFGGSTRNHRHDAYYNILLRRRKITERYKDRELRELGNAPDCNWRWCGFPNCEASTCRYTIKFDDGFGIFAQEILRYNDKDSRKDVLRALLSDFESIAKDMGAGLHDLVAFAISPPILCAMASCVPTFLNNDGKRQGIFISARDIETAEINFEETRASMSTNSREEQARVHKRIWANESRAMPKTAPDLVLEYFMRAEAWRKRQAERGYPWNWATIVSASTFKIILGTLRRQFEHGHLTLSDGSQKGVVEKTWRQWLETYRPWNDRSVAILAELEAEGTAKREETDQTEHTHEGVGQGKDWWWPSRPRAAGVDLTRSH